MLERAPAVYLCPDNFLIAQTCEQARQFGIATCTADPELPDEFINGDKILVVSVQKGMRSPKRSLDTTENVVIDTWLCARTCRPQFRDRRTITEVVRNRIRQS